MLLQIGICEVWGAAGCERIGDAEDDEASALSRVEDAGAVGESAGFGAEFADLGVVKVEDFDGLDRVGDFLPIRADVLHRRAANAAGNAAQAFDAGASGSDCLGDNPVPGFAGAGIEQDFSFVLAGALFDADDGYFQDDSRPSGVGDDEIAAATENKEGKIAGSCEGDCLLDVCRGVGFNQEAGGASNPEGGQRR